MAHFLVRVISYEWGTREREYRIEAGNFGTAVARGFREFKKEKVLGRKRIREITIKAIRI